MYILYIYVLKNIFMEANFTIINGNITILETGNIYLTRVFCVICMAFQWGQRVTHKRVCIVCKCISPTLYQMCDLETKKSR